MAGAALARAGSGVLAAPLMAACLLLGPHAQAQTTGTGVENSAAADMPDFPIPSKAGEAYSPIGEGFASPIDPRADLKAPAPYTDQRAERLKAARRNESPFLRDTELKLNNRTYWLKLRKFDGRDAEALTSGGYVSYQSGYAGDVLQLRGVIYTSQPLFAPAGAGATLNLEPDGSQITTLGQANARLKFAGQELSAGRELIRTAFINPNDNRMIPITVEGLILVPEHNEELDYIASYLWRYKPRDSEDFIAFSAPFAIEQDEGVLINGIRHRSSSLNYGVVNYWIKDTLNTAYGEFDYLLPFGGGTDGPSYRISVNDLDQRSVGESLIPGPPFNTYQASARLLTSYQGFILTTALSTVGEEADVRDPFGNLPVYTSLHQASFERAGEDAYLVTLSYDFSRLGIEGLKFLVGWGQGIDAVNPRTDAPEPDRDVLNLRFDYEPHGGPLEGLRLQLYYSDERLLGATLPRDDQTQFRAVVNYLVPLL
jgi:outer membrane OprD family porin